MSYNLNIVVALVGFTSAIIILFIVGRLGRYIYIYIILKIKEENIGIWIFYMRFIYVISIVLC